MYITIIVIVACKFCLCIIFYESYTVYILFNNVISNLEYMVSKIGWWVMNQKGCETKWSWPYLWYYPRIYMEELRKITKNLSQDSWCPSWDMNLTLLKHKWEALPLKLTCLVTATSVLIDSTTLNSVHQYGRDERLFLFQDRIM